MNKAKTAPLSIDWALPASKTDAKARGIVRRHGCLCGLTRSAACPAHTLWDQLKFIQRAFPHRWSNGSPDPLLPLFPDERGQAVSKDLMVETSIQAAKFLGAPLRAPDNSERISGTHSA